MLQPGMIVGPAPGEIPPEVIYVEDNDEVKKEDSAADDPMASNSEAASEANPTLGGIKDEEEDE